MCKIKPTPTFDKDIKRLDRKIAKRIIQKIEYLTNHPKLLRFPIKYLPKELESLQKYRIGD
jgi:mRNA-degrading endonuclease RelE of RelBE toxin-antitoxin system